MVSGLAPGDYVLQARPTFGANPMFEDHTTRRLERLGHRVGHRQRRARRGPSPGRRGYDSYSGEPDFRGRVGAAPGTGVVSASSQNGMGGGGAAIGDDGLMSLEVVPECTASSRPPGSGRHVKRIVLLRSGRGIGGGRPDGGAGRAHRRRVHEAGRRRSTAASPTAAASRSPQYTVVIFPQDAELVRRGRTPAHANGPARPAGPVPRRTPAPR